MPKLEIHKAKQFYKSCILPDADVVVLGRTRSSDIFLPDKSRRVSRFHAALVRMSSSQNQYFVRDLGSTQGTAVNGSPVYQRKLSDGDQIEIGGYSLVFSSGDHGSHPKTRIRVVQGSSTASYAEVSTSGLRRSTSESQAFTSDQREFIDQLHNGLKRGATLRNCASDLVTGILHAVNAERGFIGILSTERAEIVEEIGVTNMGEQEEIEIADDCYMQHLLEGVPVQEGNAFLFPFACESGNGAFLCINRRDKRQPFTAADAQFLLAVVGLMPPVGESIGGRAPLDVPALEPIEWPMEMVGRSKQFKDVLREIDAAAASRMNVLVLGESGSGKELVARRLHQQSTHAQGPFLARNCSQTTESLAETEIFGYAPKSSIAGADPKGAPGWFELADGGTLFLDEVHRLTPAMQDKFLRVLQDRQVWRIGAKSQIQVDVNVVAATDEDVGQALEEGRFRHPFLARFGKRIMVPPLRTRSEDIPLLAYFFLDKYAKMLGSRARTISRRGLHLLWNDPSPGNIRQLEHMIQAAVARDHEVIFSWDLQDHSASSRIAATVVQSESGRIPPRSDTGPKIPKSLDEAEKEHIQEALEVTHGNVTRAAEMLGYKSRQTMLNKMDSYGIPRNYADPILPW